MNPLAIVQLLSQIMGLAAQLVPQIEADIAAGKAIAGAPDQAALDAQITQLHKETLALTAQLDALKTKTAAS